MPLSAAPSRATPPVPSVANDAPSAPHAGACCVTCGQPAGTPFCPHCGERRAADRPLHVREIFEELWGAFVSVDGRVVRSFWTLYRRPGELTAAYVRGERRTYLTPLGVFFAVNALFFVVATAYHWDGFTAPLNSHLHVFGHQAIARRLVAARLAERHLSLAAYATAFDAVAASQGKTLLIALVPVFAVSAALVQLPRRRPAAQHVAFALHAVSVALTAALAAFFVLAYGAKAYFRVSAALAPVHRGAAGWTLPDDVFGGIIWCAFLVWLVPAVRRAYGGGWVPSAVRGALLASSLPVALAVYRAVLFLATYWTT